MPASIACPKCGQRYPLTPALAGRPVQCRKCSAKFVVPPVEEPAAAPPAAGDPRDELFSASGGSDPVVDPNWAAGAAAPPATLARLPRRRRTNTRLWWILGGVGVGVVVFVTLATVLTGGGRESTAASPGAPDAAAEVTAAAAETLTADEVMREYAEATAALAGILSSIQDPGSARAKALEADAAEKRLKAAEANHDELKRIAAEEPFGELRVKYGVTAAQERLSKERFRIMEAQLTADLGRAIGEARRNGTAPAETPPAPLPKIIAPAVKPLTPAQQEFDKASADLLAAMEQQVAVKRKIVDLATARQYKDELLAAAKRVQELDDQRDASYAKLTGPQTTPAMRKYAGPIGKASSENTNETLRIFDIKGVTEILGPVF